MLYRGPAKRGNSQPQLFVLNQGIGLCAVKFKQNPQGPRVLPNEWIGYGLATLLGIRHPPHGLVEVPASVLRDQGRLLIRDDDGDEVSLLPGIHFYSKWLEPADDLKPEDLGLAGMLADVGMLAGVAVLDALLGQWDRKPLNPNLLAVRQNGRTGLYLMDLGMAFGSAIWGLGDLLSAALPDTAAPLPYSMPPDALFNTVRELKDFEPYLEAVAALTRIQLQSLLDGLPEEWGVNRQQRQALLDFLFTRAQALPANFRTRFTRAGQEWWQ